MNHFKLILIVALTFSIHAGAQTETFTADNCLQGQDLNAPDINISQCPAMPQIPQNVTSPMIQGQISLGAWELGMTSNGQAYKYGVLAQEEEQVVLKFYGTEESSVVDELNLTCWAKGYFRLRAILQNPPAEYIKLRDAGFQSRFFQFQTDLRNGSTGFKRITSYQDHLVKWVTLITKDEQCIQPTYSKFKNYAIRELIRREL